MKRTTVYLEEQTDLALSQIAKRRGQAKAELIRQALTAYIEREQKAVADEAVPSWVGAGNSGVSGWTDDDRELLELLEKDHEEALASWDAAQRKAVR